MTEPKTYDQVTADEVAAMAATWAGDERLERHVSRWLTDHGYSWDPALSDDANRDRFGAVVDRVLAQMAPADKGS